MPRQGPRPHVWKVQGQVPHEQHLAWMQMRAQANYRGEEFLLTLEDFQSLWKDKWDMKGRSSDSYCLTRNDPDGAWELSNVACIPRIEHLRRQKLYKMERNNGKYRNRT